MSKQTKNFWSNGIDLKEFVIAFALGSFITLLLVGGIKELFFDGVTKNFISLVEVAVTPVTTAIGGVFGVQVAERIKGRKDEE